MSRGVSARDRDSDGGPYRAAVRTLLRDTLLDGAREQLRERPWSQITMADVARAAGVSRQTLYNEFGTRERFAQEFVIREGARFLGIAEQAIDEHLDDPRSAISAALEAFLAAAADDPLIGLLLSDDGTGEMLPLVTTQSTPLVQWASERLCAAMQRGWIDLADDDARLLADTFVRLAISYVTAPMGAPRETAAGVARLLGPYVERAFELEPSLSG
jgi:AcrR family transcriptional regulator